MAERGGGRELVRGLVAAGVVLLLMVLGVRTMVGRMTAGHASTTETDAGIGRSGSRSPSTATSPPTSTAPSTATAPPPSTSTSPAIPPPVTSLVLDPAVAPPAPLESPNHRGSIDPMTVRSIVREALPELRFCFEWELEAHPDLAGRVTMQFTIQEDGTVTDASVLEDALHDDTVTRCFAHVMSHLHFPPPEGGTVGVHYPFHLDGAPEARRPEGI